MCCLRIIMRAACSPSYQYASSVGGRARTASRSDQSDSRIPNPAGSGLPTPEVRARFQVCHNGLLGVAGFDPSRNVAWEASWSCSGARHIIIWQSTLQLRSHRFSVLIGPLNHLKHLISKERLPFSVAYLVSLGLTIYFAVGVRGEIGSRVREAHRLLSQVKSYIGALLCGIVQVCLVLQPFWDATPELLNRWWHWYHTSSRTFPEESKHSGQQCRLRL
jgi:hypothetical protein